MSQPSIEDFMNAKSQLATIADGRVGRTRYSAIVKALQKKPESTTGAFSRRSGIKSYFHTVDDSRAGCNSIVRIETFGGEGSREVYKLAWNRLSDLVAPKGDIPKVSIAETESSFIDPIGISSVIGRSALSLVEAMTRTLEAPYAEELSRRLKYLLEVSSEESDEYQKFVNIKSLQNFVNFIIKNSKLTQPDVVLTPEGNVKAAWKRNSRDLLRVEFLPTFYVKYFSVWPDKDLSNQFEMASGNCNAKNILERFASTGIQGWVYRP